MIKEAVGSKPLNSLSTKAVDNCTKENLEVD